MKLVKKLRKRWQQWRFAKQNPTIAEQRKLLEQAIKQGEKDV